MELTQQSGSVRTTSEARARDCGYERDVEIALRHFFREVHRRLANDVELDVRMRSWRSDDDSGM